VHVGKFVHARADGKILCILGAAMQHENETASAGVTPRRYVQPVAPATGGASERP
jgi:hypothetical protein